jgi:hypothetical protein
VTTDALAVYRESKARGATAPFVASPLACPDCGTARPEWRSGPVECPDCRRRCLATVLGETNWWLAEMKTA